ncbi:DUF5316 domain-containing protein [Peribacillus frigoritolerans]|uniref:DUF5316 domain-containing protein n=1 Tax=Peribacillus frigoritolerans TaxID=450367 RepID=UPI002282C1BF|nr:DUF5316 domain-containing protein [Peribacillus frigoritolerans]MCY9139037.1 DUF5316 domain-containing protein [Peribacillus frigoritolerans]
MKSFFLGVAIVLIAFLISVFFSDWTLLYKITGGITAIVLVLCALFSGGFVDGDRMGRNLYSETKDDRKERIFLTTRLLWIGLPNFLTAITVYFLI